MKNTLSIFLFFFLATPLWSQTSKTVLQHLQNDKTLELEWGHQVFQKKSAMLESYPDPKVLLRHSNSFRVWTFVQHISVWRWLKKECSTTSIFWLNLAIGILFFLFISDIYIQRKRVAAKREREERLLLELELKGIRSQMNPHFLFNALSSIQNLIRKKDEVNADRYLTQFAGLVRKILKHSDQEFITLEEEIEALQQYCSLEALRTPFEYEIEVAPEIDRFNTYLPSMLLQPLVENAILHGLMPQQKERKLWIKIQPNEQGLYCEIIDNGIGLERAKLNVQKHKAHQKSFGLALVRQRLQLLMNSSEQNLLQLLDRAQKDATLSGTIVQLIIPTEQ
ncbi:MAG: histidine kinase [Bacteroidota bacterium]